MQGGVCTHGGIGVVVRVEVLGGDGVDLVLQDAAASAAPGLLAHAAAEQAAGQRHRPRGAGVQQNLTE